ncbi:MAG: hypothetical protein KIT84_00085 [Labilithrix sp.]|nr:hypothetical protein [Labilithrix sp.]MCW5809380.1 hypothetical protein [Labilithrix sp.]
MTLLDNKTMRRVLSVGLAPISLAVVLGACALAASDTASKNTPAEAARDESSPADDVDVGAPNDLDLPKTPTGPGGEVTIPTTKGDPISFKYMEVGDIRLAEGDIVIPDQITSATSLGRAWPGGIVPYVIDASLPSSNRVTDAIAHWEAKTKIRFVPRTKERDYLHFRSGGGCSSMIGHQGNRQFVNLNTGEAPSSVAAVGIDRTGTSDRVFWFYKRGYATAGSLTRTDSASSHFRFIMPPGKALAALIDVAIDQRGHLFAYFDDSTVSEGTPEDFSAYALPKPYALAAGKVPSDVAGFAIDQQNVAYAYYKDGTFSTGDALDLAKNDSDTTYTLAAGKTPENVHKVEVGRNGFVVFYNLMEDHPDGGAPFVRTLEHTVGTRDALAVTVSTIGKTTFTGNCPTGATIHEIGHAMGLFHEQTRHDRDEWVKIMWENIQPENRFNFEKHSLVVGADIGPYDFQSIMHYGPRAFSSNGKDTIVALDGTQFVEQRQGLSDGDLAGIRAMYGD